MIIFDIVCVKQVIQTVLSVNNEYKNNICFVTVELHKANYAIHQSIHIQFDWTQ